MELPVYSDDGRAFGAVRDRRVLIYWPHGLGDFVHLSLIAPLLEPSNDYFITRFGDEFVHLYDDDERVRPLLSGSRALGDGSALGARPHLGIDLDHPPDALVDLDVPEPLRSRVIDAGIEAVLVPRYPEMTGRTPYPWHTKARFLASRIVSPARLALVDWSVPLRSALRFRAPAESAKRLEARLRDFVEPGTRLYAVAPGGHTQADKIWPEEQVAAFAREARARDPLARVISIDERTIAERFGDLDVPFAHVLVTLLRAAHAFVGVASGPLHCAIAMGSLPAVGIWLSHWPEYYDEPSERAIHLVGPRVYRRRLDRRLGARTKARVGVLPYRIEPFRDRMPSAADALDALGRL